MLGQTHEYNKRMKSGKKKVSEFQRQQMSGMSSEQIKKDSCKLIVCCLNVPVCGRRPIFLQSTTLAA
jgi:hypothetical protein